MSNTTSNSNQSATAPNIVSNTTADTASNTPNIILISGAQGGIASALYQYWLTQYPLAEFILISRGTRESIDYDMRSNDTYIRCDLSQSHSVNQIVETLKQVNKKPDWAICCSGILHNETVKPEKSLSQFSVDNFNANAQANLFPHAHLTLALNKLTGKQDNLKYACLSARVASISDNQLGGWHSYRMSKAALNMFVKNVSIEWQRKYPNHCIVSLHPGTTDTTLSEPFQKNIPASKLYSPELTAERIDLVFKNLKTEQSGQLLHWDGEQVGW